MSNSHNLVKFEIYAKNSLTNLWFYEIKFWLYKIHNFTRLSHIIVSKSFGQNCDLMSNSHDFVKFVSF